MKKKKKLLREKEGAREKEREREIKRNNYLIEKMQNLKPFNKSEVTF